MNRKRVQMQLLKSCGPFRRARFGARNNYKKVGTFGDLTMLRFCQNKIIILGEGGAIVTDSREAYEKKKLMHACDSFSTSDYYHVYQMYTTRVNANNRDELVKFLTDKGIMTKAYFPPVHSTYFYRKNLGIKPNCQLRKRYQARS